MKTENQILENNLSNNITSNSSIEDLNKINGETNHYQASKLNEIEDEFDDFGFCDALY